MHQTRIRTRGLSPDAARTRSLPRWRPVRTGALARVVVIATALAACGLTGCGHSLPAVQTTGSSPSGVGALGTLVDIPVPAAARALPLIDQHGRRRTLSSWPGRTILLVPFMTLCQEECPLTTGNLLNVARVLRADHASGSVQIIELSIDPQRDTPARLAAYAKLAGLSWTLVTESPSALRALARTFGFYYARVPEGRPPARDWLSGRPLTYDIRHSDNYFVVDPAGRERVIQDAAPDVRGRLSPKLSGLLDPLGRQELRAAPGPSWTPRDVLDALSVVLGRPLPG
jgi:protein SCO1